jgi:type II secretory pathway pseudopilin PulG
MAGATYRNRKGFSILSVALALGLLAIMISMVSPKVITMLQIHTAEQTAYEMVKLKEAARWYYIDNTAWPASINTLITSGYAPVGWPGQNPWGNAYQISSVANRLVISTQVPQTAASIVVSNLPASTNNGSGLVTTSTVPPGIEDDRANFLSRSGTVADRTMGDVLSMSTHNISNLATATNASDLLSLSAADARYLPKTGGTMTGNLTVHSNLVATKVRDSSNAIYFESPSATGYENLWNANDVWVNSVSKWLSEILTQGANPGTWNCWKSSGSCCPTGYALIQLGSAYYPNGNIFNYNPASYSTYYYKDASNNLCLGSTAATASGVICCN